MSADYTNESSLVMPPLQKSDDDFSPYQNVRKSCNYAGFRVMGKRLNPNRHKKDVYASLSVEKMAEASRPF